MQRIRPFSLRVSLLGFVLAILPTAARATDKSFIGNFNTVKIVSTTVPANGDVNPYGVARVPVTMGRLVAGQFLISNFNDSGNFQGTGYSSMRISEEKAHLRA